MKKLTLICCISFLMTAGIFALEVDKDELQSTESTTIEFINYTGPHKIIDSAAAITAIGSNMGAVVAKNPAETASAGTSSKYRVVHAIDANESGKLDADILYIGSDATVDHIDNLRRIIAGYLVSAYGYNNSDAKTLSVFITVYNAVYRGKLDSYKNKYKNVVVKNLSSDNCGLSVNYKDWPGKSEIVIPLYDVNGGLSTVDTSVISDSKVVDSMKEDDDRNVESRKEMVDIKERESDAASEKAQEAQKEAVQKQKEAETAKEEAKQAHKEAETAKKTAEEKQKAAEENPEDKQAQADKKETEAQKERKEIAKDQNEIQKEEAAKAKMPTEYGIILSDETEQLSRLVKFNKETGEIIQSSPVSVIRERTIFKGTENYIAIAGENSGNGAIKLVTIDPETMEINGETDLAVSQDSVLIQDASSYICVTDENGSNYVAKFGEDMSLKAKSTITVKSATPITSSATGFIVTDSNGRLRILDKNDLSVKTDDSMADAK